MTVYLWHMAPVIIIAIAVYPSGLLPQPAIATASWWALRLAWFVLLTEVLVLVVLAFSWADEPRAGTGPDLPGRPGRPDRPGRSGRPGRANRPGHPGPSEPPATSAAILLVGLAAAMVGLARLAIAGFAPGGRLPVPVLVVYAVGVTGVAAAPLLVRRTGTPGWRAPTRTVTERN
jgi:hypothetical protein